MGASKLRGIFLFLICIVSQPLFADQLQQFPLIRDSYDEHMQLLLDRTLSQLKLNVAVEQKRLSVALVDITDVHNPRLSHVNGDEMMYAASLPKIGILFAALYDIQAGKLNFSDRLQKAMVNMIRYSSNIDATFVMNMVGKYRVNKILASEPFRLYDENTNGGLWVGKEYGKNPAFQRDPLHNISHGATAIQVARLYYLLETGQLLSPRFTRMMKEFLSKPGINHKFVKGLAGRNAEVFRKSGTWRDWHADSAIVKNDVKQYIIVALAKDKKGGDWLTNLSTTIYDVMIPQKMAGIIIGNQQKNR